MDGFLDMMKWILWKKWFLRPTLHRRRGMETLIRTILQCVQTKKNFTFKLYTEYDNKDPKIFTCKGIILTKFAPSSKVHIFTPLIEIEFCKSKLLEKKSKFGYHGRGFSTHVDMQSVTKVRYHRAIICGSFPSKIIWKEQANMSWIWNSLCPLISKSGPSDIEWPIETPKWPNLDLII